MASLTKSGAPSLGTAWHGVAVALGAAVAATMRAWSEARVRADERSAINVLGPQQLKDIGLTRGDIERTLQRSDYWR
jgi:uncharacterized protein YjiS (DUF1127 family)